MQNRRVCVLLVIVALVCFTVEGARSKTRAEKDDEQWVEPELIETQSSPSAPAKVESKQPEPSKKDTPMRFAQVPPFLMEDRPMTTPRDNSFPFKSYSPAYRSTYYVHPWKHQPHGKEPDRVPPHMQYTGASIQNGAGLYPSTQFFGGGAVPSMTYPGFGGLAAFTPGPSYPSTTLDNFNAPVTPASQMMSSSYGNPMMGSMMASPMASMNGGLSYAPRGLWNGAGAVGGMMPMMSGAAISNIPAYTSFSNNLAVGNELNYGNGATSNTLPLLSPWYATRNNLAYSDVTP